MIVSTKGRYALRVLTDLAEQEAKNKDTQRTPLKEIAERQDISQKYIEAIMTLLSKNGFVDAVHGKGGGYKLNRKPEEYKIGDILRVTEGNSMTGSNYEIMNSKVNVLDNHFEPLFSLWQDTTLCRSDY